MGYLAKDKNLAINKESVLIIRQIFMLKNQGNSLREIARQLNEQQVATARGKTWYAATVRYILSNKIYEGYLNYKDIQVERRDLKI